jgi:hypothetical protein
MRFRSRYVAALALLVFWVLAGPLAASFGACAAMGSMCEGPCGVGPCAIFVPTALPIAPMIAAVETQPFNAPPSMALPLPELPPKSAIPSA